jgi:hypothetical protein
LNKSFFLSRIFAINCPSEVYLKQLQLIRYQRACCLHLFMRILWTIVLSCLPFLAIAKFEYNYDQHCRKAYTHFLSLQVSEGNAAIIEAVKNDPRNLMATYIADYEDCILLLFNGDRAELEQRKSHMSARLELLEKGDQASPWYRLCRAGVYMHWALIYMRFGDNLKAAGAFRKSFTLLRENKKLFPAFSYNNVFLGLEEAIISTIPGDFKWLASVFGMKGDLKSGMSKLSGFLQLHNEQDLLYRETLLYENYLRFYLMFQQQEVWSYINSSTFKVEDNLLHLFFKAHLALNYRKADIALTTLQKAKQLQEYNLFPILDYEMASAYLLALHPAAPEHYRRYISRTKSRMFVKESWMKMAYSYYISGDNDNAERCRAQISGCGSLLVDADKQAQRFAESKEWPNKILLQARLLTDGGYNSAAYQKLSGIKQKDLTSECEKVEYYFRMARVYDEIQNDEKAIALYKRAAEAGRYRKEHFAARALLQTAFIYEKRGNRTAAVAKFNECLSLRGHDFQNSIDQQAKAGINRLSK